VRIRAKKKDFLRAFPITQYSSVLHSIALIDGKPIRRAPKEICNPIAAEIAMRVPAYEPGPSPTTIVSAAPNFSVTPWRFSKKRAEFFRSFGQSRVKSVMSSSNHARLPRTVESSSARIFTFLGK
jgi:hypothetical protein